METKTTKNDWNQTKSKIKAKYGKLTDENLEAVKDNLALLSGKLQHAYGYAKEQADKEVVSFKASLHSSSEPREAEEKRVEPIEKSKEAAA